MRKRREPGQAEVWNTELARHGRVGVDLSRRRLWFLLMGSVAFSAIGLAIVFASSTSTSDRVAGSLSTLMGVVGLVVFGAQLSQSESAVVVDSRGVSLRWMWRGTHLVPWSEIQDAGVFRTRGNAMVLLFVSSEFEQAWLKTAGSGRTTRVLAAASRGMVGAPSISLPSPLKADADELASWIKDTAGTRG